VTSTLSIATRFNGPPGSGNGGYVCGLLAQHVATPASRVMMVTLRRPPPLEQLLTVGQTSDGLVELRHGEDLIADATAVVEDPQVVAIAASSDVNAAEQAYRGATGHPFPTCFVCGTERAPGDGLCLRPGPVAGLTETTACSWIPDESLVDPTSGRVGSEFVWAALDCPGAWTLDLVGRPMVVGRMTARVNGVPRPGDRCVVMGQLLGREGRKAFTATTVYGSDGAVLGAARSTWFTVDPRAFAVLP
jgi:hypothetical protein